MNVSDIPDREGLDPPETVELDGRSTDADVLGGKGAALDRLVALGLTVPPSGVVTTVASRRFAEQGAVRALVDDLAAGSDRSAEEIDEVFLTAPLADSTRRALEVLAASVGGTGRLAIRSSATVEDLAGSSFAGQYRSVLDVDARDPAAVEAAVKLVFASLWHPAPRAYRAAFGIDDGDAAMAVVVMRMVPAVRAGVVFTVDPGGSAGSARVEVVEGLGESLVSGQRTPDAYVLTRDGTRPHDLPPEVVAALDAALRVEQSMGTPQDVEWAWADDTLWLVQARPITAGIAEGDGFDSPIDDHELTTAGIGEMLPGVLAPLSWELNGALVNESFGSLVAGLGAPSASLDDRPFVRRVAGRAALDFSRLRELASALPGGSPDELELQYFGSRRPGRPAAETAAGTGRWQSLVHDLRSGVLRRRANLDAEICIEAVAGLVEDLPSLDDLGDVELLGYRARLFDLALRTAAAEMIVAAGATTAYRKIELLLLPHLGSDAAGHHAERVTTGRGVTVTPHLDASAAVFGGPSWRELGRTPVVPVAFESAGHAWHALQRALASSDSWGGEGFRAVVRTRALRRIIEDAVAMLRRREDSKAALLRVGGEMRRVHMELGRRLVRLGVVDAPLDIELFTTGEVQDALAGHPPPPVTIATRRRWLGRHRAEPPLPVRFVGRPVVESVALPEGGRFEGWAASPGRYEGVGVVVESAGDELPDGAVLIATATDASWSPLFLRAGAIVVERGGPLSHAAILARELGVPAVLNVVGATQHLDGALVTVDGDAGVVVAHEVVT